MAPNVSSSFAANQFVYLFAFFVFITVIFVGFDPFPYGKISVLDVEETGSGNLIRQVVFVLISILFVFSALRTDPKFFIQILGIPLMVTFLWCGLSIFWSVAPAIAARRFFLLLIIAFTVAATVVHFGADKTLKYITFILLSFILLSVISAPIIPGAVHNVNDFGAEDLIGNWRGVFNHKNSAGPAAAILLMLSIYMLQEKDKNVLWILSLVASAILLIFSVSKTSIGLLLPSVLIGFMFQSCSSSISGRKLFASFVVVAILMVVFAAYYFSSALISITDDPEKFTGRAQIWQMLIFAIEDSPWLGWGYQSLWSVGNNTPLLRFTNSGWVLLVAHGHNGYLDTWASVGIIGLFLAVFSVVLLPLVRIALSTRIQPKLGGLYISLMTFLFLHNLTESTLLMSADARWVMLLFVIFMANYSMISARSDLSKNDLKNAIK